MAYRRAQNVIAESKALLPICLLLAGYVWYEAGYAVKDMWVHAACLLLAVILVEMVNFSHTLLRVDSRMTGSLVLLLNCTILLLIPDMRVGILQLCMAGMFFTLFYSYEKRHASGWVFYAFLCLGLASMVFVKVLCLAPLLWIILIMNLRSLTAKSFVASLLGMATPYWFASAWYLYQGEIAQLITHVHGLLEWTFIPDYLWVGEHTLLALVWGLILALISIVHYIRQGYQDNVRPRMFYNGILAIEIAIWVLLAFQPQYSIELFAMHIVCLSFLLAHFLTLTRTLLTNIVFFVFFLITLALSAYHLWMPSSNFLSTMVIGACA